MQLNLTCFSCSSLSLWGLNKKKPLTTVKPAHLGPDDANPRDAENWITAVTSLQQTDLIASGTSSTKR